MTQVAIVIVTYNSEDVIGKCLDACGHACPEDTHRGLEVIVVDNASSDATGKEVERHPGVRWITNSTNRGFAAEVNQGVRASVAPYVLLLNPDTELLGGVDAMAGDCAAGAGAVGGKLVDAGGTPQAGFAVRRLPTASTLALEVLGINRIWPGNPVNRRYRCLDWNPEQAGDAEQPAGAFLMFRRDAWEVLEGFDEGFHPLWFEDVDFCKRLQAQGLPVRYQPLAVARHQGGHSIGKMSWECRNLFWYASLLRYSSKFFCPADRRLVRTAVIVGAVLRAITGIVTERSLRPLAVYGKVLRLALG
jgi:N-acetylglucosaminyl-diphospho-decaprenol L-rhamnosyltransferase